MSEGIKISDEEFIAILRENRGLFATTARAIEHQYGIEYSRQAVRQRALNFTEEMEQIKEAAIDSAENGLLSLMDDQDKRIKIDAIKYYLDRQGKNRGYYSKQAVEHSGDLTVNWNEVKTYEKGD